MYEDFIYIYIKWFFSIFDFYIFYLFVISFSDFIIFNWINDCIMNFDIK